MRCVEHPKHKRPHTLFLTQAEPLEPCDPLQERPLISDISSMQSGATMWWLAVKLTRWSTMTTTDYPGSSRVTSLLRRALSLRPIEVL